MNPDILKALRKSKGLSQEELAIKLNVVRQTVSKWETGRGYPDITLLEPIAETFGISVTELLSGSAVRNRNRWSISDASCIRRFSIQVATSCRFLCPVRWYQRDKTCCYCSV